jgi:hypothetical protein
LELVDHLIETYKGKPLEQFLRGMSLEDHGVLSQSGQSPKREVESVGGTGGTRTGSNNRNFSNVISFYEQASNQRLLGRDEGLSLNSSFGKFPQGKADELWGRLQKTLGKWTKSGK